MQKKGPNQKQSPIVIKRLLLLRVCHILIDQTQQPQKSLLRCPLLITNVQQAFDSDKLNE